MVHTILATHERYAPRPQPGPLAHPVWARAISTAVSEGVVLVGQFGVGASPRVATDA